VQRGEAAKRLREHGKWISHCERIVFLTLLDRSDNTDCTVPGFLTPSLKRFAEEIGYSKSTTAAAMAHLEEHGWLIRTRAKPGRGHKTSYRLEHGWVCDCPPNRKGSGPQDSLTQKGSRPQDQKGSDFDSHSPSSDLVLHVGSREGEGIVGVLACEVCSFPLDPTLSTLGDRTHLTCVRPGFAWPEGSYGEEANSA
jgi:hypothetical protein